MTARFDAEDVRTELRRADIVARYGLRLSRSGRWLRSVVCPACGGGESEAFAVGDRGFRCHRCERTGDLIGLVALLEGLDVRRDFERVLGVAAAIAGVPPRDRQLSAAERATLEWGRQRARRELERQRAAEERERFTQAAEIAGEKWAHLRHRNRPGEAYLIDRGLRDLPLDGSIVRFDDRGSVRVPLYDSAGRTINVVARYLPGRERQRNGRPIRVTGMTGCPTRGTFGDPAQLSTGADVVVTEGVFDYLSARVIWPERAALGAHGCANLPHVTELAAERLAGSERVLWQCPHPDNAGRKAAIRAYHAARAAGLPRDQIKGYSTGDDDLNAWLCASNDDQEEQG